MPARSNADPAADWAATAGAGHIDWRLRAACRDEDPELFFPVGAMGPALLEAEQAKQVCRRCAVTGPCLVWALETGQDHGIWGGMSEEERRALRRSAAARHGGAGQRPGCPLRR